MRRSCGKVYAAIISIAPLSAVKFSRIESCAFISTIQRRSTCHIQRVSRSTGSCTWIWFGAEEYWRWEPQEEDWGWQERVAGQLSKQGEQRRAQSEPERQNVSLQESHRKVLAAALQLWHVLTQSSFPLTSVNSNSSSAMTAMNKLQLWQHPFVDLFKYVHLQDWMLGQKEGDVTEGMDKSLGKRVFKLVGSVCAANFIQIPRPKTSLRSLGLTGRFLYFQLLIPPSQLFALHLDFSFDNTKTRQEENLRISISNIFKGAKTASALQIACTLGGRWTVLCVDLREVLRTEGLEHLQNQVLKGVMLCANMTVRGVYTSNIQYTPKTLPKEMTLKLKADEEWTDLYDWVTLPLSKESQEQTRPASAPAKTLKPVPRPITTTATPRIPFRKPSKSKAKLPTPKASPKPDPSSQASEPAAIPPAAPAIEPVDPYDDRDSMEPDPLLRLQAVIGYTPLKGALHWVNRSVLEAYPEDFLGTEQAFVLCSSGPSMLLLNPGSGRQHILFGHMQKVDFIRMSKDKVTILSGESAPPLLYLWNLLSRQSPTPIHPYKLDEITSVDISDSGNSVVVVGLDSYSRYSLQILDISKVARGRAPVVTAKQLSDFTVNEVRFEPGCEDKLGTVGKASIRFWKVKNEHLPGSSVTFTDIGRKDDFLCLEYRTGEKLQAIVGSADGYIFLIDARKKAIDAVFQLHESPILSLIVNTEICVTAGSDGSVRVWPPTFLECSLDLTLASSVLATALNSANSLVCGLSSASLGQLSLTNTEFRTLLRAHSGQIMGMDVHPLGGWILTAGEDRTIRIWAEDTFAQTHEFEAAADYPLSPAFHPQERAFACGFASGFIRLFDMDSACMTLEIAQYRTKAEVLVYHKQAKWLLSMCEDGTWSLLDCTRSYQTVKSQSVDRPPPFRTAAFAPEGDFFVVLGAGGTSICAWDCLSLTMKAKFMTGGTSIRSLAFVDQGLAVVTNSQPPKLHIYELNGFKLTLQREFPNLHSGYISNFAVSSNSRYLLSTGEDRVVKIWDYLKPQEGKCQSFLGHTSPTDQLFLSKSLTWLLTASRNDGLFLWEFLGVKGKIRPPRPETPEKLGGEDRPGDVGLVPREECVEATEEQIKELLTLAATTKPGPDLVPPSSQQLALSEKSAVAAIGYTPTSANSLVWEPENGWLLHTMGTNISLIELKEANTQRLLIRHLDDVTHLALSPSRAVLATAVARARLEGFADIVLWDTQTFRELKTLSYHDKGVHCLDFSPCSNYLVSVGNAEDALICVWELSSGSILCTSIAEGMVVGLSFDRCSLNLEFAVIGADFGTFWRINKYRKLEFQRIEVTTDSGKQLCLAYTYAPSRETLLLIGTSQGCVMCIDSRSNALLKVLRLLQSPVTVLRCTESRVVMGGSGANLYSWKTADILDGQPDMLLLDGDIVALSFPIAGEEGVVGTANGTIWYVNWTERATIKIRTSHSKPVQALAIQRDFLVSGSLDRSIRVWNSTTMEPVTQFTLPNTACTCLTFHPESIVFGGFQDGTVRAFHVGTGSAIGKCRVYSSPVTAIWIPADASSVIAGSETGILTAVFIESLEPFRVRVFEFGMAGASIECLHQSSFAKCLLAATTAGRVNVWERKPKFQGTGSQEDQKLFSDEWSEFNLIDVCDLVTTGGTLHPDHLTEIDTAQQAMVCAR